MSCASPFIWFKRDVSVLLFHKNGTSSAFF